jgi:hypothetical protein
MKSGYLTAKAHLVDACQQDVLCLAGGSRLAEMPAHNLLTAYLAPARAIPLTVYDFQYKLNLKMQARDIQYIHT